MKTVFASRSGMLTRLLRGAGGPSRVSPLLRTRPLSMSANYEEEPPRILITGEKELL